MSEIRVHSVGLGWQNGPDDLTDRPNGVRSWQLQHFYDPVLIRAEAEIIETPAHSCMLWSPQHPQWFKAAGPGFSDDWLGASGAISAYCEHYHVPINQPFVVANATDIERCWREIHQEWQIRPPYSQEALNDLMVKLIRLLARGLTAAQHDPDRERRRTILALRGRIRKACHEDWSVPAMAAELGLSSSRFSICYRAVCGDSPQRDLTAFRMHRAMELLLSDKHSVAEVAELCGYRDALYFSRVFRRYFGRAPSTVAPGKPPGGHHRALHKKR